MNRRIKSVGIVKGQVKFGEGGVKIAALASRRAPDARVLESHRPPTGIDISLKVGYD